LPEKKQQQDAPHNSRTLLIQCHGPNHLLLKERTLADVTRHNKES